MIILRCLLVASLLIFFGCSSSGNSSDDNDQNVPESDLRQKALLAAQSFVEMPRNSEQLARLIGTGEFSFGSGTPYNDLEYTIYDTDYMEGETNGYDTFFPVDPSNQYPGSDTIKLVRGVNNLDLEAAYDGPVGDRIILGGTEYDLPFFVKGQDDIDNDYLVIQNYDFNHGHIELGGSAQDYYLLHAKTEEGVATQGFYLFYVDSQQQLDLIAFIFPCDDLGSTISGNPPRDDQVLCNSTKTIQLDDGINFKFAQPKQTDIAINSTTATQFGSNGKEIVSGVVSDINGSTYSFGASDGSLISDSIEDNRLFVIQHLPDGSTGWIFEMPVSNGTLIFDATLDHEYLYAVGRTLGELPGFVNQGRWDAFILKIALADGSLVASTQFGNSGLDGYGNVTLDDSGHLFVSGAGSPEDATGTDGDYLLAKYRASDLENVWRVIEPPPVSTVFVAEAWGGISYHPSTTPGDGSITVAGWYMSAGGADSFIGIYQNLNEATPVRTTSTLLASSGQQADWILDNVVDSQGNIFIAGYTTGKLGEQQLGDGDAFIAKYDPQLQNPEFIQLGTVRSDMFRKLYIDANDNLFAVGYSYGDYSSNNLNSSQTTGDVIIQSLSTDLVLGASLQIGTAHEERGDISLSSDRIFVAGMTEANLTGLSNGAFDGFVVPLDKESLKVLE